MIDSHYQTLPFQLNEQKHRYGPRVHLLSNPVLMTQLARLCSPECIQPEMNLLLGEIYQSLAHEVANQEFPQTLTKIPTRMFQKHPEAAYEGTLLAKETKIILVSLARAGILPAMELFHCYSELFHPKGVRIDHVMISRTTNKKHKVTGAEIGGSKIGGPIQDAFVIIPDPMGATGNSICQVIQDYQTKNLGTPKKWILLNLIVTPEYIQKVSREHSKVEIYALRLDRAFSSKKALQSIPGKFPKEESGLNQEQYIVPGGGGFGELTSNSWV